MKAAFEVRKSHLSGVAIAFQKVEAKEMVTNLSVSNKENFLIEVVFSTENKAFEFFYQLGLARVEVIMSQEIKSS